MNEDAAHPAAEELLAHAGFVRRLALALARDPVRAADLEQETWLAALKRPPRHGGNPRGWLAAVMRNLSRMGGRADARRARREGAVPPPPREATPDELVARLEVQRCLVAAVRDLDEAYRTVVLLRYFAGLGPTAIARRLGCPVRTVETRLRRALDRLRTRLDGEHGGDRGAWIGALVGGGLLVSAKKALLLVAALLLLVAAVPLFFATDAPPGPAAVDPTVPPSPGAVAAGGAAAADGSEPTGVRRIDGRVFLGDEPGAAEVSLYPLSREETVPSLVPLRSAPAAGTRSDREGRFRFDGLRAGTYFVTVGIGGGSRYGRRVVFRRGDAVARVTLVVEDGPHTFSARAATADGSPFRGRVSAFVGERWGTGSEAVAVPVDESGRFRLGGLPEGRLGLLFTTADRRTWVETRVPYDGDDFLLDEGARPVRVRVVDAATGEAIAGAQVRAVSSRPDRSRTIDAAGETDAAGVATLPVLGGSPRITAGAEGRAEEGEIGAVADEVILELRRRVAVSGRVLAAESGEPLPDVPVVWCASDGSARDVGRTDESGAFRLEVDPVAGVVFAFGGSWRSPEAMVPADGAESLELVAAPAASLSGRIVVPNGEARDGWLVFLRAMTPGADPSPPEEAEATTGTDGSFAFATVRSGVPFLVVARRADGAVVASGEIRLDAGEARTLRLVRPGSRTVDVTVVAEDGGDPIAGARVSLRGGVRADATTDAAGRARLEDVPEGAFRLAVERDGYAPAGFDAFENEVTVRLPAARPVAGRVLLDGRMPPNVLGVGLRAVGVDDGGWVWRRRPIGEDGSFSMPAPPGEYELVLLYGDSPEHVVGRWSVAAGTTGLTLEPGTNAPEEARVEVRVTGAGEATASDSGLLLAAGADPVSGRFVDGVALFPVPGGPFRVLVTPSRRPATLAGPFPAGTRTVEVTLPSPAPIRGRVVGPAGAGVADVPVRAFPVVPGIGAVPVFLHPRTQTDANGRFTLDGIGDGEWLVHAGAPADLAPGADVRARAGADSVRIRLHGGERLDLTVVGPDGKAVAGADVVARLADVPHGLVERKGRTDEEGRVVLAGLGGERPFALSIDPPWSRPDLVPARLPAPTGRARVVLAEGRRISGRVEGPASPWPGARVFWRVADGEWRSELADGWGRFRILVPASVAAVTLRAGPPSADVCRAGSPVTAAPGENGVVLRAR